jgi:acetoin utilization deacetylase AcuC-like enzyme
MTMFIVVTSTIISSCPTQLLLLLDHHGRVEVEALLRFHTSKHVDSVLAAFDSAEAKARQVLNNDPPKTSPTTGGGANKGGGGIANEGAAAAAADSPSAASSEFFSLCAAEVAKKSELGNKLSSTDGVIQIDGVGDTACMWGTGEAAMRAAGAAIHAVDGVMTGKHASAFVAVRPPGHHAEPDQVVCSFTGWGC